jgi:hypothetical protein
MRILRNILFVVAIVVMSWLFIRCLMDIYVHIKNLLNMRCVKEWNRRRLNRLESDEECMLCGENHQYDVTDRLSCDHRFHRKCLHIWSFNNNTCYICAHIN